MFKAGILLKSVDLLDSNEITLEKHSGLKGFRLEKNELNKGIK